MERKDILASLDTLIEAMIDELARRGNPEAMAQVVAVGIMSSNVHLLEYVHANYKHMLNDEQQAAMDEIHADIAEFKQAQDNPLTQHLSELNSTVQ